AGVCTAAPPPGLKRQALAFVGCDPFVVLAGAGLGFVPCPGSGCYAAPNTGALRARSDVYGGSWEGFTFEWIGEESTLAMKSQANGLYVAVEENYTGASQNLLLSSTA
ncbi:hypothetical protein ABZ044_33665, partial [Streptomyces werraensis]